MTDRQPQYPGRVLITPEDGSAPYYATLALADEPLVDGTPLNKANLLSEATAAAIAAASGTTPETPSEALALVLQNASYDPNDIVATASGAYNVEMQRVEERTFTFPWSAALDKMPSHVRLELFPYFSTEDEPYEPDASFSTYYGPAVIDMWYNSKRSRFDGIVKGHNYSWTNSTMKKEYQELLKGTVNGGSQTASTGYVSGAIFSCYMPADRSYARGFGGSMFFPDSGNYAYNGWGYNFQYSATGVSFKVALQIPTSESQTSQFARFSVIAYAYK